MSMCLEWHFPSEITTPPTLTVLLETISYKVGAPWANIVSLVQHRKDSKSCSELLGQSNPIEVQSMEIRGNTNQPRFAEAHGPRP